MIFEKVFYCPMLFIDLLVLADSGLYSPLSAFVYALRNGFCIRRRIGLFAAWPAKNVFQLV